ncbi:aryl-alcohol dehydrogenase-like predicted oxidoreductase [Cupriavidus gilardii J11]|uniref:Aryl-alcohol dehydrogenase-like predicted oxidoreductase n=1 Tax=Cupriavidus gilardii J11 TaxID=936133 RepID=A0A562B9B5_9BURK|nr:aldo/keto reductase [Cupriavidus gilardii]TWG81781.1 aryl-alcohol dehydrogenase-like predicted oxidoreductase [Cupriavidus gilardii J11]
MRYRKFGRTGLFVSELCLGTMTFGGRGEMWQKIGNLDQREAEALIGHAIDAGINFIDTANVYSEGRSEEITGQALKNLKIPRENVVIATKVYGQTGTGALNSRGLSRHHILDAVKDSLRRLQLDHIDLYQVHGFDPHTPIDETLHALDTLVRHGHVRYIGVSNWAAWQIMKALGTAQRLGLARFESLQAYYTIAGRDIEREIVPMLQSEQVGLMVWSPLAGGLLSGKFSRDGTAEQGSRRVDFDFPPVQRERAYDCIDAMREIAGRHQASVAQVALAWLLHQKAVTSVIVGAKRVEQLRDNIAASALVLSAEELAALDAVSALPPEYPGWMLTRQGGGQQTLLREAGVVFD